MKFSLIVRKIHYILLLYRGADNYETGKWAGYGNDGTCTNPKLLWESVVVDLEEMVSDVKFSYY